MDYSPFRIQLLELAKADAACRDELVATGKLFDGYHPNMRQIHEQNALALREMIQEIGYPSVAKVGTAANEAAWLVAQHAISEPVFMEAYLDLVLKVEKISVSAAYLSDRIAVFRGRGQHYGTQYVWREDGLLHPAELADPAGVDERRSALGLPSVAEQTTLMRQRAAAEGDKAPTDLAEFRARELAWRREVGWLVD